MEIKVLPTRAFFGKDLQYIRERLHPDCTMLTPESYSEADLMKLAPQADIFMGPVISRELCQAAPRLKFIQIPWTGVDGLDFSLISEIGVTVCNSHSNAYAVAEHAIALMLAAAKKLAWHDAALRRGEWNRPRPDGSNVVSPFSQRISEARVGILGYGHIGRTIHRFLSGFGCRFTIIDATVENAYTEGNARFFPAGETESVLGELDFLFLAVPLTGTTRGMVSTGFLEKLNETAILVNVSRGEVLDEDALYHALKTGRLGGAGIDTWYNYPKKAGEATFPSARNAFHELPNIVLSPHRSAMVEGELPHLDDAITNINRAAEGLQPLNIISTTNQY